MLQAGLESDMVVCVSGLVNLKAFACSKEPLLIFSGCEKKDHDQDWATHSGVGSKGTQLVGLSMSDHHPRVLTFARILIGPVPPKEGKDGYGLLA
jgi:hypothetical protein